MTCEEFAAILNKEHDAVTNAEVIGLCNHSDECKACDAYMAECSQKCIAGMTAAEIAEMDKMCQARAAQAMADEEAYASRRHHCERN